jgi:hypothetical protein
MDPQDHPLGEPKDKIRYFLKVFGRVIGVISAFFMILARGGVGPSYLDSLGKAFLWTGLVLVPLCSLNLDLLRVTSGRLVLVALTTLQLILAIYFWERLQELSLIILASLSFAQCLIFFLPLMLIRKLNKGVWY